MPAAVEIRPKQRPLFQKADWLFPAFGAALLLLFLPAQLLPAGNAAARVFFPLLSLWADLLVLRGAALALQLAGMRLRLEHWLALAAVFLLACLYTAVFLARRDFIYYWDYSNYLLKQYEAEAAFQAGPGAGFALLAGTLAEDYTSFITLFTEFPFCLTSRTGDAYVACQLFSVFPPLLVLLAGLIRKVGAMCRVGMPRVYFLLALALTVAFPFVRAAALMGQPDWFGLVFALTILLLTLDYRFERTEPLRLALLFLATGAIILTRRWYLYFVVSYYFVYVVVFAAECVRLWRQGEQPEALRRARRLAVFGLGSLAAMGLLFWPLIRHILGYDYAARYGDYNLGGFFLELAAQGMRLLPFYLAVFLAGIWYACRRRQLAALALALGTPLLSIFLFTRVQNMWTHQTLMLLPGELLLFIWGAAALTEGLRGRRRVPCAALCAAAVVCGVFSRISPMTILSLPAPVLDAIPLAYLDFEAELANRDDTEQIRALARWLDANCADGESAYIIPHDVLYNPDTFRNSLLPDQTLREKIAFGFDILGTHPFPTELFDAKYVVTCEPFPLHYSTSGLSAKLNALFLAEKDDRFSLAATFDMGNGTVFSVYERTAPADRAEVQGFLDAFAEEDAQFPDLYSSVVEAWAAARGLE